MDAQQTATKSLTIPAREARPGDVLFGMTVDASRQSGYDEGLWFVGCGSVEMWLHKSQQVTVERPAPSDPIDTVRVWLHEDSGDLIALYRKVGPNAWRVDGSPGLVEDSYVDRHPILWKPGMPIPCEAVQA